MRFWLLGMCRTTEYWPDELCGSEMPNFAKMKRVKPEQSNRLGPVAP